MKGTDRKLPHYPFPSTPLVPKQISSSQPTLLPQWDTKFQTRIKQHTKLQTLGYMWSARSRTQFVSECRRVVWHTGPSIFQEPAAVIFCVKTKTKVAGASATPVLNHTASDPQDRSLNIRRTSDLNILRLSRTTNCLEISKYFDINEHNLLNQWASFPKHETYDGVTRAHFGSDLKTLHVQWPPDLTTNPLFNDREKLLHSCGIPNLQRGVGDYKH